MSQYDSIAARYDAHFRRQVDRWEDDWLASQLRPHVNGKRVLDLGCGTGWLMDHCHPAEYTGVDDSAAMLEVLTGKHPGAVGVKLRVGDPGWQDGLPSGVWDVICSTWSLEYLGDLAPLLRCLPRLLASGGMLALHGSLPRGHRRKHFSVKSAPYRPLGPAQVKQASEHVKLRAPLATGTSAWPDSLPCGHRMWLRSLALPAGVHYSCLWRWWPDGR